jgi:hypothetical protein
MRYRAGNWWHALPHHFSQSQGMVIALCPVKNHMGHIVKKWVKVV